VRFGDGPDVAARGAVEHGAGHFEGFESLRAFDRGVCRSMQVQVFRINKSGSSHFYT
jgi:hypothetical protein